MRLPLLASLASLAFALVFAPGALAGGGHYGFDGGTSAQQAQVRAALEASSFDWGVVPGTVIVHIGGGDGPHAAPGAIWLDGRLLDSGRFSWGVVQHEYAHQVDFALLTDPMRGRLHALLGGTSWWEAAHATLDGERFADALAWAYWPSPANPLRPAWVAGTSAGAFRATLGGLLQGAGIRVTASAHPRVRSPKG
jgi:hypothetical protein